MKKKVAFFIRSLHLGGAEKQSIYLTKELSKNYDITLIVFYKEGEFLNHIDPEDRSFYFLEGNTISKLFKLYQFLRKQHIQVLFNLLPINNIVGTIIGKLARVKFIFNGIRGVERKSNFLKMETQLFLSNYLTHGVVSNSYRGKEAYASYGLNEKKITVIHNLIPYLPPQIKRKKSSVVKILTVGRFVVQKDFPTLLKALKELKKKTTNTNHEWELNLVGYGNLENELKALTQEYDLSNYVKFNSGKSKVQPYFESADIYVSTSVFEGMPNAIMEAMSYSLPIVSTDAGDSRVLVTNDKNGYLCEIGNANQISDNLFKLINNESKRLEFGRNSYENLKNNFSSEIIGNQYRKLIDNL